MRSKTAKYMPGNEVQVPSETVIYYTVSSMVGSLIFSIFLIGGGIYAMWSANFYVGIFIFFFGLSCCWWSVTLIRDRKPEIILSEKGIETINLPLYSWEDIYEERVELNEGSSGGPFLEYKHPFGKEKLKMGSYTVSPEVLKDILVTYRRMYEENKTASNNAS